MSSSILLSPLTIRKTTLRNRIMLPSMVTHYCAVNGEVSERLIAYHAERAYGGVGLNMLESTSVDDTGKSYWPGVSIASDHFIKGLRRLTDAIHAHGGKAGIQLNHAGRLAQPAVSGHPRQLVSYIPGLTTYDDIHVMDEDDIERVIGSFCSAAERAAEAGFDVVEIHGAHGYLLSQFMSPLFNRREDAYGGSFEKRMRVPVEVIRGIRKRLGPDFPLFFRCSVEEYLPGGITLELARDIARTVADNGIDLFNVSVGLGETNRFTGPPPCLPKGWNADRAAAIKEALGDRALVGVAGRIIDRESADAVLNSGKADLVVMGRALIADPDLPNKLAANRDDAVIPCVGCNEGCVARLRERKAVACAVNPRTGCEGMYPRTPAAVSKHVAIVGGGPAGMQAALIAAERGHRVTLFEKRTRLGGLANIAALPPHKDLYAVLVNRLSERLIASGVKVFLGTAPSVPVLAAHLFVMYFAISSGITPPVCLVAYAGAAIADAPPMKTGFTAFKLGIAAFIVPFIFIFEPALLLMGDWPTILQAVFTAVLGVVCLASSMQGWLFTESSPAERVMMFVAGIVLVYPGLLTDLIGFGTASLVFFIQIARKKRLCAA